MNHQSPPLSGHVPPTVERRHDEVFIRLIRECALEGGIREALTDEEALAVLDHFWCPDGDYRPLPAEDAPEFLAELQRRSDSPRPHLSAQTVAGFLRARRNGSSGG